MTTPGQMQILHICVCNTYKWVYTIYTLIRLFLHTVECNFLRVQMWFLHIDHV